MDTILNRIDRLMMAITFAEANEPELAKECIANRKLARSNKTHRTKTMNGGEILPTQTAH